jgi:hypothetical protein
MGFSIQQAKDALGTMQTQSGVDVQGASAVLLRGGGSAAGVGQVREKGMNQMGVIVTMYSPDGDGDQHNTIINLSHSPSSPSQQTFSNQAHTTLTQL